MTFSERMGLVKVRESLQVDSLDEDTRTALWNIISPYLRDTQAVREATTILDVWTDLYHKTSDSVPATLRAGEGNVPKGTLYYRFIRKRFFDGQWNECFDLLEFLANQGNRERWNEQCIDLIAGYNAYAPTPDRYNVVLKSYNVGYRFVGDILSKIIDEVEIETVERGLEDSSDAVRELLQKAVLKLSDRTYPDYAKSVECAISAVESQCCIILGEEKVTLGDALNRLERQGVRMHSALKEAWKKLYGFTSNDAGIRHGSILPSDVDQDLAKFMLVACSAFVNYLISKAGDLVH